VEEDKPGPSIMQFAALGMMNALCWLGGMAAGWFVDSALGTLPIFLFVGLALGIVAGVAASRSEWRRFS
jgi:F0F1-type ATP synthase assembly protein I